MALHSKKIETIDDVITQLEEIILSCEDSNNPLGYFAALYQKVTIKVQEEIKNEGFEDSPRMEKLDIIFAKRYLDAYHAWNSNQEVTLSWEKTFKESTNYWPIVLQHLLLGMNAHINLDLGVSAAEVSKNGDIGDLENDFKKINEILSSLVNDVQSNLAEIWPTLKKILRFTKKVDDFLVDFSMELARDGAWDFANSLAKCDDSEYQTLIEKRDKKIAEKAKLVLNPGIAAKLIFKLIRLGEHGTISERIKALR